MPDTFRVEPLLSGRLFLSLLEIEVISSKERP